MQNLRYRVNSTNRAIAYLTQIRDNFVRMLMTDFNLHYGISYEMMIRDSVKTFQIIIDGVDTDVLHNGLLKNKNKLSTTLNASQANKPFYTWRGNTIFINVYKPAALHYTLDYDEMMRQLDSCISDDKATSILGVTTSDIPFIRDYTAQKHSSYNGASQCGKSNTAKADLIGVTRTSTPDNVRIILADPVKRFHKWMPFNSWRNLRNLAHPPIDNLSDFLKLMSALQKLTEDRRALDPVDFDKEPHLIVFIDEFQGIVKRLKEKSGEDAKKNPHIRQIDTLMSECASSNISIAVATQSVTIGDAYGTGAIMDQFTCKIGGKMRDKKQAAQLLGVQSENVTLLPQRVGEFIACVDGQMCLMFCPEVLPHHVDSLTGPALPPLINLDETDEYEAPKEDGQKESPAPKNETHPDWDFIAQFPAEMYHQVMRTKTARGAVTTAIIKAVGYTKSTPDAQKIRDLFNEHRSVEHRVTEEVKTRYDGKFYNPFPC